MQVLLVLPVVVVGLVACRLHAQEEQLDPVSRQAAALETDLGKLRDTSPEAAEVMLKLVDLYHDNARVFGLIRVGEAFVTKHPGHPQNKRVMLEWIDGLEAMSRNKELSAACRQFLTRYSDAPEAARLELLLAQTLELSNDRPRTAEAYAVVWKRQPTTPVGRSAAVKAIGLYGGLNSPEGFTKGAEVAEALLDSLPAGEFASEAGQQAVNFYRRLSQWAKANLAANKTLAKMPSDAKSDLRELHYAMALNYASLSQSANAVVSLRKALELGDRLDIHQRLIAELHNAAAQPAELEPVVEDYLRKYSDRPGRETMRNYLAQSYLRAGNKPRAAAILAELLPVDAVTGSSASLYVQNIGTEPAQLAECERVLKDAITKNAAQSQNLRYVLATELYRDRIKDTAKFHGTYREILANAPTTEGLYQTALNHLLNSAASDDEFKDAVTTYLATRKQNFHRPNVRNFLKAWITANEAKKDLQPRLAFATTELAKADKDPELALWLATENTNPKDALAARVRLIAPRHFEKLNDEQARGLLSSIAAAYGQNPDTAYRRKTIDLYAQFSRRFPQDAGPAYAWMVGAFDQAQLPLAKEALLHLLTQEADYARTDLWYRMITTADRLGDADLVKRSYEWILKAQSRFGFDSGYAELIGDALEKHKFKDEALAYWRKALAGDPNSNWTAGAAMRLADRLPPAERKTFLEEQMAKRTNYHGTFAVALAGDAIRAGDLAAFEKVLTTDRKFQDERPLRPWSLDPSLAMDWADAWRGNKTASPADKQRGLRAVQNLNLPRASALAQFALLEDVPEKELKPLARLLAYQAATRVPLSEGGYSGLWDRMLPYVQAAMTRKDYEAAAVMLTGMLANSLNIDPARQQAARELVAQSYARMGGVGLTIDESSPIAPLLQAAMYLRLGDDRLALETYTANKTLFDQHRAELPVDLLLFVSESLVAAGGDENLDKAEDILRGWLVKNSEAAEIEATVKASVQLLLARNYFKAQRYDVARNEFTTVMNRYPKTPQAREAEFGIGESFMAQKVYEQAEAIFEKLAASQDRDVVIRAEFLRGVLANRRGDRDQARDIFRAVLDRVPDVELANQALYNLAEVYGAEERYIDQLELLRTVGRLGRASKRWHAPGTALSIVVQDSDLGISRGHTRIPVRITTEPGGDEELIYLYSGGAGKGLFRADVDTHLGQVVKNNKALELTGRDVIKVDYPDDFKKEFRVVPISDAEIRIASNGQLDVSGSKIVDEESESFSQRLERESREQQAADQRKSQNRPANQIKPGNPIYMRLQDADRDLSDEADKVTVKLVATSGDQVQVALVESGPHTGIFESVTQTGELPAGALASDTSIEHSPLMAIDQSSETAWISQPDGATPKWLSVDMKDLHSVTRVTVTSPDATNQCPVRGELQASHDGRFWFRIASQPPQATVEPVAGTAGPMAVRVYAGNYTTINDWPQVVELTKSAQPIEQEAVEQLSWNRPADAQDAKQPFAVVWHGRIVQKQPGAARILLRGARTALLLDGEMQLPLGPDNRSVDVWLERGVHELTIFAAVANAVQGAHATWAKAESMVGDTIAFVPFRRGDFDLDQPEAQIQPPKTAEAAPAGKAIALNVADARLQVKSKNFAVVEQKDGKVLDHWQSPEDVAQWDLKGIEPGLYDVSLEAGCPGSGNQCVLELGQQVLSTMVQDTGAKDKFRKQPLGTVLIGPDGTTTLTLKAKEIRTAPGLMTLRQLILEPAVGTRTIVSGNTWAFHFPPRELRHLRFMINEYRGDAVAINRFEVAGTAPGEIYLPTKEDVLALANNNVLEMAAGDTITASYADEFTQNAAGRSQLLTAKLSATYHNGLVDSIAYDFVRLPDGQVQETRKRLKRIDPGERFIMEITDYDEDQTADKDQVSFEVSVNDGPPLKLSALETLPYSGIFTREVDTVAAKAGTPSANAAGSGTAGATTASSAVAKPPAGKLVVKPGDRIYCRYRDLQNTFPGHSVVRETVVYVNEPSVAQVRVVDTRLVRTKGPRAGIDPPRVLYLPGSPDKAISSVAFEVPLTVEVIDRDAAKDSKSRVTVELETTSGAKVDIDCVVSNVLVEQNNPLDLRGVALEEGRFVGQIILQLGSKSSPDLVPVTASQPRNLVGGAKLPEEEGQAKTGETLVTRVLNLTGKDIVTATYHDQRRPDGKPADLAGRGRLIANGALACTDHDYEKPVAQLHVGEKLYLMVTDADLDVSDERDQASVEITSTRGEKETLVLEETLAHSGVFTGSVALKPVEKPTPGNLSAGDAAIETYFGDQLQIKYVDEAASTETGKLTLELDVPVVVGTDGLVGAFSKTFDDEQLAVETQFHIAESYFELFKSHMQLGRKDEQQADLEAGRRVLKEVMQDYPSPKHAPRIAYLLGQFSQELRQWDEAIASYQLIVRQFPDSSLAADAQYKLAQCYEEAGDFDNALEAYVTLAATYPKSPLIANVMVRISDHFYKKENYVVSAQVCEKFLQRFDGHEWAPRMAFRIGQCYYKGKQYTKAADAFDRFTKLFPDDNLSADALFWAGESFRTAKIMPQAFRRYNRCRWDFPASEAAKYARGRLALPEMLTQFEAEAKVE